MVGIFCEVFQGTKFIRAHLLCFPFLEVFFYKLFADVKSRGRMVGNIVPTKPDLVRHPGINIPHEGVRRLAGLPDLSTIQRGSNVVLSILKQHGHS